MFEDSLVESSGKLTARHPWATFASFAAQCIALGSLLLLSLIYTESLPSQRWIDILQVPPPPPSTAPVMRTVATAEAKGTASQSPLVVPREVPREIEIVRDGASSPVQFKEGADVFPGGIAVPGSEKVMDVPGRAGVPIPKLATQKVRVSSGVAQGSANSPSESSVSFGGSISSNRRQSGSPGRHREGWNHSEFACH
jgi:hypothetical protein